jgi:hypothetical protein
MEFQEGMWQCRNCFSVLSVVEAGDDVLVEEDLTMGDVMEQYEDR